MNIQMNPQTILLAFVSLMGIPIGFWIRSKTKEEMKPGRKWLEMISIASVVAMILTIIFPTDSQSLHMTTLAFIFFISSVPLLKN
jgi:uncharacterized membrane protein HdeD (DUF308 family)